MGNGKLAGFGRIFEHLFFNGSRYYPHMPREAMDGLDANNRDGRTNNDQTNRELPALERGVVSRGKRRCENRPYGRVFSRTVESVCPFPHP